MNIDLAFKRLLQIFKSQGSARGGKYIQRIKTGNPLRPWRYIYNDTKDNQGQAAQDFNDKKSLSTVNAESTNSAIDKVLSFFGMSRPRDLGSVITAHVDEYQQPGTTSISATTMKDHMLEYFQNKSIWDKFFKKKEERTQALAAGNNPTVTSQAEVAAPTNSTKSSGSDADQETPTPPPTAQVEENQNVRFKDRAYKMSIMKFLYNKYKNVTSAVLPSTSEQSNDVASSNDSSTTNPGESIPVSNPTQLSSLRETFVGHQIKSEGGIIKRITIINQLINGNYSVTVEAIRGNPLPEEFEISNEDFNNIMAGDNSSIGGVAENTFGDNGQDNFDTMPDQEVQYTETTTQTQVAQQPATSNLDPIITKHLFNQKSEEEKKQALIGVGGNLWEFRNMRRIYFEMDDLARGQKFYYNLATKRFEGKNLSESKISELAHKIRSQVVGSNSQTEAPNNFETMPENDVNPVQQNESSQDTSQSDIDPVTLNLDSKQKGKVLNSVKDSIAMMFNRLASYPTSPFAIKLRENNITLESLQSGLGDKSNIQDILKQLHENLKTVDAAHNGLGTPSYDWARNSGDYANAIYNETIKKLVAANLLPVGYDRKITRTVQNRNGNLEIPPARELAERARRAEEEIVRQNEVVMTTHAQNIEYAQEYYGRTLSAEDKVKLAKGFNKAFGKDFNLKSWVDSVQHPDPRLTTKIEIDVNDIIRAGESSLQTTEIPFKYIIKENSSDTMVTEQAITRSIQRLSDGSIKINNFCFSRIRSQYDNTYRNIASAIYSGTEKLLREITANLPEQAKKNSHISIGQAANSGFSNTGYAGAVVWAKNYYDFANLAEAKAWKLKYKEILKANGTRLGLSSDKIAELKTKIDACKYPYEFMSLGHKLTVENCQNANGINNDIKRVIQDTGGYDIGAWIMLKTGTWWHAVNYINGANDNVRQQRVEHLNQQRDKARARRATASVERAANPNRQTTTPAQPQTPSQPVQPSPTQSNTNPRRQRARSRNLGTPRGEQATMQTPNGNSVQGESFPSGLFLHREGRKWVVSHSSSGKSIIKDIPNKAVAKAVILRLSQKNWAKSADAVLASPAHVELATSVMNHVRRDPSEFLREVIPAAASAQDQINNAVRRTRRPRGR